MNLVSRNLDGVSTNHGHPQQPGSSYYRGIEVQEFDPKINGMVIDVRVSRDGVDSRFQKSMTGPGKHNNPKGDRNSNEYQQTLEKATQRSYQIVDSQRKEN